MTKYAEKIVGSSVIIALIALSWVIYHIDNPVALTTMQNVAMAGLGYLAGHREKRPRE